MSIQCELCRDRLTGDIYVHFYYELTKERCTLRSLGVTCDIDLVYVYSQDRGRIDDKLSVIFPVDIPDGCPLMTNENRYQWIASVVSPEHLAEALRGLEDFPEVQMFLVNCVTQ